MKSVTPRLAWSEVKFQLLTGCSWRVILCPLVVLIILAGLLRCCQCGAQEVLFCTSKSGVSTQHPRVIDGNEQSCRGANLQQRRCCRSPGGCLVCRGQWTWSADPCHSSLVTVLKGGELEEWEPRFTWHAFRYVEISGFKMAPQAPLQLFLPQALCWKTSRK